MNLKVVSALSMVAEVLFLSCGTAGAMTLPDNEWERIDLDDDHTSIEAVDKSRRSSAIPTETGGDLEVPSVLRGFQVVSIGKQAFSGCSKLTSVIIPEGVTNIADQAFYNCSALTNVVFPSTLKSIGSKAFVGCSQFLNVNIEVPRLTIGDRAFRNCDELRSVRFKGDELVVKDRAFFGCGKLLDVELSIKDVNLAEGVFSGGTDESYGRGYCDHLTNVVIAASNRVELGDRVFRNCDELRLVRIEGADLVIGIRGFFGCGGLLDVKLKAQKVMLAEGVFSGGWDTDSESCGYCEGLTNAEIAASGVSTFGDSVFYSCSSLRSVELPIGLSGVPKDAFHSCTALQSVSLSSNVTTIAYRAFDTCTALRTVELSEGLRTIEDQAFYGCEALVTLHIPQSVSQIGARAFEQCKGLGRLVFCEGDTNKYAAASVSVGERAFYRNASLTNVVLSQAVSSFGNRAFAECATLTSVNLPTNLAAVSEAMFELCEQLPAIDLPASLTAIGSSAFNSCTSLVAFSVPTQKVVTVGTKAFYRTKYWNDWPDNSLVENNGYILGFKGNPTSVDLPENCKEIPNGMFEGMSALTNVTIPAGLERVGSRAFVGTSIVSIDFSKTKLSSLGASAFCGCSNLVSCVLAEKVTAIPDEAFRNCASLSSFDIPALVSSIGASAFRNCVSLEVVTGGEGVRTVGDSAFSGCVKLQPFRFPDGVAYGDHVFQYVEWTENVLFPSVGTMAQEYPGTYAEIRSVVISSSQTGIVDRACAGCAALESVSIPDGVRRIGVSAFEDCVSLKSVSFPADFSNIGSNAFKGCTAVASLTVSGGFAVRDVFPSVYATISDVKIADGATGLCEYCFAGCAGLTPGITIPENVEEIGDYAFQACTGLNIVRYMGPQPTAKPNIYAETKTTLVSGVRKKHAESWTTVVEKSEDADDEDEDEDQPPSVTPSESTVSTPLPERWPSPQNNVSSRRIAWWSGPAGGGDKAGSITFYYYDTTGGSEKLGPDDWLDEPPDERDGYDFAGWWTKPYGGTRVESAEECAALGVTAVYAHWVRNRDDHDDPQSWEDVVYNANVAHVYDGYLLDGDVVVGTVQIKTAKGKYDREDDETDVKVTATAMLLGEGKKLSFKGTAEGVADDGGSADLVCAKRTEEREMSVTFSPNELSGDFDGYTIVGARNMFGEKTDWDKRMARAAIDDWGGTYAVVLEAAGDSPLASGNIVLTIKVGAKGKCKVTGTMPDGTKVSVSSQLQILYVDAEAGETACELPVVVPLYTGKRGGFGFRIDFSSEMGASVVGLSEWIANPGKSGEFTATLTPVGAGIGATGAFGSSAVFSVDSGAVDIPDVSVDDSLLPDGVPFRVTGKRWTLPKADTVKFVKDEGYVITKDNGNPSGLKLTFTASTGAFKGSFKVYAVTENGKSKKYTAQVTGAVVDGIGYGTAVIKKACSMPVVILPEEVQ